MGSVKGLGVDCPTCHSDTKVVDTYWSTKLNAKARRRRCLVCDATFRTVETVVPNTLRNNHKQAGSPRGGWKP